MCIRNNKARERRMRVMLIIRDVQFFRSSHPQPPYYVKYVHSHLSIPHRVISQCYYKNNRQAAGAETSGVPIFLCPSNFLLSQIFVISIVNIIVYTSVVVCV